MFKPTEENVFVNKLFFSLNISEFSLFSCKNSTNNPPPPEKSHPLPPQQLPSKNCDHVKPPPPLFFEIVVGDSTHPAPSNPKQKRRGSHYVYLKYSTYLEPQKWVIFGIQLCPINHKTCRSLNFKTHIFMGESSASYSETD